MTQPPLSEAKLTAEALNCIDFIIRIFPEIPDCVVSSLRYVRENVAELAKSAAWREHNGHGGGGLGLRDTFAGQFAAVMLHRIETSLDMARANHIPVTAYAWADEMLKARETPRPDQSDD